MSDGFIPNWGPGGGGSYYPEDRYETGYRNGESNREADAVIFHEEVLRHKMTCGCPLADFLRHLGIYESRLTITPPDGPITA